MAEQQSILAKFPVDGSISFKSDDGAVVVHPLPAPPPPDMIVMRDESGQPWAITVGTDGQLRTAKWPDGEPRTMSDISSDDMDRKIANALNRLVE